MVGGIGKEENGWLAWAGFALSMLESNEDVELSLGNFLYVNPVFVVGVSVCVCV